MNCFKLHRKLNKKIIMIVLSMVMVTMTACNQSKTESAANDFSDIEKVVEECENTQNRLDEDFYQAVADYEDNKLDEALEEFKNLLAKDDENSLYHYACGNVYLRKKEYDNALKQYDQSIKYLPEFTPPYNNAAGACMVIGQLDKAIEYINRAIEIEPDNSELKFKQGQLYFATEKYEDSILVLEALEDKDSNPDVYRFLGLANLKLDHKGESLVNFKTYMQIAPKESKFIPGIQEIIDNLENKQS